MLSELVGLEMKEHINQTQFKDKIGPLSPFPTIKCDSLLNPTSLFYYVIPIMPTYITVITVIGLETQLHDSIARGCGVDHLEIQSKLNNYCNTEDILLVWIHQH